MNNSSAVFISNVDDYLAPSQACVNPLYNNNTNEDSNEANTSNTKEEPTKANDAAPAPAVVVPRQRRRRPRVNPTTTTTTTSEDVAISIPPPNANKSVGDPIKASMADCLACSGCVTTAETVLLEQQHSLTALKTAILQSTNPSTTTGMKEDQQRPKKMLVLVATISPAVWADMLRHLQISTSDAQLWQAKLASSLQDILQVSYVLDGNIPLQWALLESAEEFCRAYQKKHNNISSSGPQQQQHSSISTEEEIRIQQLEQNNTPSVAINSQQTNYMLPDGSTQTIPTTFTTKTPNLPILTSSCPALVLLAEKANHGAVRHLSKTKSPMSLAGAWWRCQQQQQQQQQQRFFHLAFMPCHDKKLEASRKDFLRVLPPSGDTNNNNNNDNDNQSQDVDLVLTTQEWFQMLVEHCQNQTSNGINIINNNNTLTKEESLTLVKAYLQSLPPAHVIHSHSSIQSAPNNSNSDYNTGGVSANVALLLAAPLDKVCGNQDTMEVEESDDTTKDTAMEIDPIEHNIINNENDNAHAQSNSTSSMFFTQGSGGLAEFVFRYAAWRLFDTEIDQVPWKPVDTTTTTTTAKAVSARMRRAAAKKNRDYYQATLYRYQKNNNNNNNGNYYYYSCSPPPSEESKSARVGGCDGDGSGEGIPVLRFGIAYGLQTVQRILEPFQQKQKQQQQLQQQSSNVQQESLSSSYPFDFVEAMACPSGCLNGGGQLRVADRETPTQTRQRVALTRDLFVSSHFSDPTTTTLPVLLSSGAKEEEREEEAVTVVNHLMALPPNERRTRFHVVPPLQHSLGAAAGIAVKDTQW